ncbi:MAG: YicC family protein, partial [Candidatus Omnitrophica bacterium]|nr:YicC family protein [Candidatus Omnitrophota bacterium]
SYLQALKKLQRSLGLKGEISLSQIIALPGVVAAPEQQSPQAQSGILKAAKAALAQWDKNRRREGKATEAALQKMVHDLEAAAQQMHVRTPQVVEEYRTRLTERIQALTAQPLDAGRLEQEIAFFAKECDIAEEIIRIQAHAAHLKTLLNSQEPVGRTLDFVAQELHREVNTVGSKSSDVEVTRIAIRMKGWVEQLREQAQNIE